MNRTTERLRFRSWRKGDLGLAMGLWGDPRVTRLIDAREELSREQVGELLEREIEREVRHGVQYWPIFSLENGEHVGCAGLRPYRLEDGIYELGVHLRFAYWGRGLATEAARAVIEHAFDRLGAKGLFAGHHPANDASRRLLSKLGFRYTHDEHYAPTGLEHPSYLLEPEDRAR